MNKVEDTLLPAKKTLDLSSLKLHVDRPVRPGYGTKGTPVMLTANYVELLPKSGLVLYKYDIQINQEVKGRKLNRILQLLLESAELAPYRDTVATDFRSTLISKQKFEQDEQTIEIVYRSEGEDEPTERATTYRIHLRLIKALSIDQLTDYLNSTNIGATIVDKSEFTQALNIFLNHYAKSANNLATIGSTKTFSIGQGSYNADLGRGLSVIRGFFSSVRTATCRILVNVNISHGAFYHDGPLPRLMDIYGTRNLVALEKFLKLVRVETTHLPVKKNRAGVVIPRIKTIGGLARKDDGHELKNRPRVKTYGAGAKDVEFWLEGPTQSSASKGKGKAGKGGKAQGPAPTSGAGRYTSVYNFFKESELTTL